MIAWVRRADRPIGSAVPERVGRRLVGVDVEWDCGRAHLTKELERWRPELSIAQAAVK